MTTQRRKKRTRAEMIADLEHKLAKYRAQEEGTFEDQTTLKMLKRALKARQKALHQANILLHGREQTPDRKSPPVNSITVKIENAQRRVDGYIESKRRAEEQIANLPFDIEKLQDLVTVAESGEEVEFPQDLFRLPTDRTDRENEVNLDTENDDIPEHTTVNTEDSE